MCNPYVTSPENLGEWSRANQEAASLDARLEREAARHQVRRWVEEQGVGE